MILLHKTGGLPELEIKNLLNHISPEPLTQIKYNFTELFLMMHSTQILQMVSLHWSVILRWVTQGPRALLFNLNFG